MSDSLIIVSEQYTGVQQKISRECIDLLTEDEYIIDNRFGGELNFFRMYRKENEFLVDSKYFVGVDWIIPGKLAVYIEPKLNDKEEVDFFSMLLESFEVHENLEHLDGLFHVDYDAPWISIPKSKDKLSPVLIVQFLKLTQRIVQKGLKKSYYRVTQNFSSRVKGKILVGAQIRSNIVKNRLTNTVCNYQEYGFNTEENQFIKLVLDFVASYIYQAENMFGTAERKQLHRILKYCQPAFEHVDTLECNPNRIHIKKNVFYKEYEEAYSIGTMILKRFSFNISKVGATEQLTPPHWIDMSKLFELYVFRKLCKIFRETEEVTYHDKFRRKETDLLISAPAYKCVIDCKYKPSYRDGSPELADKRQLAGYTRLASVYKKLKVDPREIIKGLIIYPHQDRPEEIKREDLFHTPIAEYIDFYKLGVRVPGIKIKD